jgi:hypothetical protein
MTQSFEAELSLFSFRFSNVQYFQNSVHHHQQWSFNTAHSNKSWFISSLNSWVLDNRSACVKTQIAFTLYCYEFRISLEIT